MKSRRIAFINGKGGCGKTTSIFHVAGVLAHRGEKVLVVDLDKQRNTTDILLMDSVKMHEICFSQMAEYVIVPFSSDIFSVSGYGDLMETINKARDFNTGLKILGIYLSRFMENCAVDKFILSQLKQFGDMFIDVQIPLRADIREAIMFGRPLSYYKLNSTSLTAYKELVSTVEEKIEKRCL